MREYDLINSAFMKLKISVQSCAYDTPYGGEQIMNVACGEFILDEIFRLHFFRLIIDDVIDGNVCFRLMEGAAEHYYVLNEEEPVAKFERETPIGWDDITFTLEA